MASGSWLTCSFYEVGLQHFHLKVGTVGFQSIQRSVSLVFYTSLERVSSWCGGSAILGVGRSVRAVPTTAVSRKRFVGRRTVIHLSALPSILKGRGHFSLVMSEIAMSFPTVKKPEARLYCMPRSAWSDFWNTICRAKSIIRVICLRSRQVGRQVWLTLESALAT